MSKHPAFSFGVSQFTTWPWSFERDVERFPTCGIDAIEICEFKLNRDDYQPQLSSVAAAGLAVSSVQSTVHSIFPDSLAPQPTAPEDRVRHIRRAIERIAPHVPSGTPFVVITGAAPGGDSKHVYQTCQRAFAELAEYARQHGVRLAYEPLNPVLFNTDTALWGLDQALTLVDEVAHPALGLCCDTWNIFQTPQVLDVIASCGQRIFVVQVSDWQRPRCGADRISLGQGSIDTPAFLRALRASGFNGPYVLEIFSAESLSDSIWRADLDVVLRQNRAAFAQAWEESQG